MIRRPELNANNDLNGNRPDRRTCHVAAIDDVCDDLWRRVFQQVDSEALAAMRRVSRKHRDEVDRLCSLRLEPSTGLNASHVSRWMRFGRGAVEEEICRRPWRSYELLRGGVANPRNGEPAQGARAVVAALANFSPPSLVRVGDLAAPQPPTSFWKQHFAGCRPPRMSLGSTAEMSMSDPSGRHVVGLIGDPNSHFVAALIATGQGAGAEGRHSSGVQYVGIWHVEVRVAVGPSSEPTRLSATDIASFQYAADIKSMALRMGRDRIEVLVEGIGRGLENLTLHQLRIAPKIQDCGPMPWKRLPGGVHRLLLEQTLPSAQPTLQTSAVQEW